MIRLPVQGFGAAVRVFVPQSLFCGAGQGGRVNRKGSGGIRGSEKGCSRQRQAVSVRFGLPAVAGGYFRWVSQIPARMSAAPAKATGVMRSPMQSAAAMMVVSGLR